MNKKKKKQLEIIIKKCLEYGIPVATDLDKNGEFCYIVSGFSKSGEAEIYIEDDTIICKTRYNRIDHIITFSDLAYIAYDWYLNYKDRETFTKMDQNWIEPFDEYIRKQSSTDIDDEDLPF